MYTVKVHLTNWFLGRNPHAAGEILLSFKSGFHQALLLRNGGYFLHISPSEGIKRDSIFKFIHNYRTQEYVE